MQNTRFVILAILVCLAGLVKGQDRNAVIEYIATYKNLAMNEMKRTGVPAAIKLAQGIHETDAGQSVLVRKSNNHFGIKCKSNWTGASVKHDDDARNECFRAYGASEDSYKDHSNFLKGSERYASLFRLDPTDYSAWAWGLKKAGYATNPKYPQVLIRIIKEYNLQNYTLIAMGKMEESGELLVKNEEPVQGIGEPAGPEVQAAVIEEIPAVNYPVDEFRINDTRVVYVTKGTAFLSVAQRYDLALSRLFEFNDMRPQETATEGQLVFLQRKRKVGANEFHIVQPGETLYSIAQSEGIRIESLLEYNLLKTSLQPAVGERLHLRTRAGSAPRPASSDGKKTATVIEARASETVQSTLLHTVQRKETLYTISKTYGVTVDDLMTWNQMQGSDLKPGQQLKIYKTSQHGNHKGS